MLVGCFGISYVVGLVVGHTGEDILMVIAGPLLFVCDAVFRRRHTTGPSDTKWWYHYRRGGQLFFIPIWAMGTVWMLLGAFRLLQK